MYCIYSDGFAVVTAYSYFSSYIAWKGELRCVFFSTSTLFHRGTNNNALSSGEMCVCVCVCVSGSYAEIGTGGFVS